MLEKNYQKLFYLNHNKLFFSSIWLVWSIGILFRCVVSLKVRTYSFTLKLVLCNFMIFKGKDFIQYASNRQITFDKLSNPKKRKLKLWMRKPCSESTFSTCLIWLPNLGPLFIGKAESIIIICLRLTQTSPIDRPTIWRR